MAKFPDNIIASSERHHKPADVIFQYGTAGFRTKGATLDSVLFRTGILAALRSQKLGGKTVGVMVTASHNPAEDNGVKLVDPRGEMLEASWEKFATVLANAPTTHDLVAILTDLVLELGIDTDSPARVVYARDTRPSGVSLVSALEDGLRSMEADMRDEGVTTTPILHYLVRCINTKGTSDAYGQDDKDGYYVKLASSFATLIDGRPPRPPLVVDCAHGVGALASAALSKHLNTKLPLHPVNLDIDKPSSLNHKCGADYVKTTQSLPIGLEKILSPGQRACSLDGDADRLMYYYLDAKNQFHMLDGDKIAALVSDYLVELVHAAGLADRVTVGVVQTAYANGNSTRYLSERLTVTCVSTGVKHLHHAAEKYPIGVYFEANGHGTVLFSPQSLQIIANYAPRSPVEDKALRNIQALSNLINQTVGDGLSDMLLVEVVLAHKEYSADDWDSIYMDLPNRLVKLTVSDRNMFVTEDAERRLTHPAGLQKQIDAIVSEYPSGRGFVRPSGTEDVVRIYAEAASQANADDLARRLSKIIQLTSEG